jgi:hypothetical protein
METVMSARRLSLITVLLLAATAVQAAPAAAVAGVQRTFSPLTSDAFASSKNAVAWCPPTAQVVGGGGWVDDHGARRVVLTALSPVHQTGDDYYEAIASAPPGFHAGWSLRAYAICAPTASLGRLTMKFGSSEHGLSSDTFQHAEAVCDAGQKVLGTGARVYAPNSGPGSVTGEVGLQLVRASGPLDIVRATAREDADGFAGQWQVLSWAMCADPVPGQHVDGKVVNSADGVVSCATGKVHGAGGGGSITDSGPVFLQVVYPDSILKSVTTSMTGTPTDGMVVSAVCAT